MILNGISLYSVCENAEQNVLSKTRLRWTQGAVVVVITWYMLLDLQLSVQSVPISTKVVNSNPAHYEVYMYSIQIDVMFGEPLII